MSLSIAKLTASCSVLANPVRCWVLLQLLTGLDARVWNPGTPLLQLSDGDDWPRPQTPDGNTRLSPARRHKPSVEPNCTNGPGVNTSSSPPAAHGTITEQRFKGTRSLLWLQTHQRPPKKDHTLLSAWGTFRSRPGCPRQQHAASLCHLLVSCSTLGFHSWFSVEVFLGEGDKRHKNTYERL